MDFLDEIKTDNLIWVDPGRMNGVHCFIGTRVPVQALIDHIVEGSSLDEFLNGFPSVTREQALAVLEHFQKYLLRKLSES